MTDAWYGGRTVADMADIGAGTFGPIAETSVCYRLPAGRIIADGYVTQVKVRVKGGGSLADVNAVRVWRDYTRISSDVNLLVGSAAVPGHALTDGEWATLTTPIACQAGDAIGLEFDVVSSKTLATNGSVSGSTMYYSGHKTSSTGAWVADSGGIQISCKGSPVSLMLIGDSTLRGGDDGYTGSNINPSWYSPNETDFYKYTAGPPVTADNRCRGHNVAARVQEILGLDSSMSIGGCSDAGQSHFAATYWDSGGPEGNGWIAPYLASGAIVVARFGLEDIINSISYADHLGHWNTILGKCQTGGYRLVRINISHLMKGYSAADEDAVNATVDTWNTDMATWCETNGIENIDVDSDIDWDIGDDSTNYNVHVARRFSVDMHHPSPAQYERQALDIATALEQKSSSTFIFF